MPYPFLRPDERPKTPQNARPSVGLRVTYPNNVQHWFPGPEPLALLLAKQFCPEELLNHTGTTLEFGTRCGNIFVMQKHLSGPILSQVDQTAPRIITPDVS